MDWFIDLFKANNLITSMIEDDLKRQKQKEADKLRERAERKKSPKLPRKTAAEVAPKSPKLDTRKMTSQQATAAGQAGRKAGGRKQGKEHMPRYLFLCQLLSWSHSHVREDVKKPT